MASWVLVVAERVRNAESGDQNLHVALNAVGLNAEALNAEALNAVALNADELSGKKYNLSYMLCDKLYVTGLSTSDKRSFCVTSKDTVN